MSLFLPNPCLLGIMLSISTHNGPQLVFHYPPRPKEYNYQATPFFLDNDLVNSQDISSDDTDDTSDFESESEVEQPQPKYNEPSKYVSGQTLLDLQDEQDKKRDERNKRKLAHKRSKKNSITSVEKQDYNGGDSFQALHKVFGFDVEFVSEIVNPPRQLCNTKFELTVDDMAFLGLPIHINEEGLWRNSRLKKDAKSSRFSTNGSEGRNSKADASTGNDTKVDNTSEEEDGDDENMDGYEGEAEDNNDQGDGSAQDSSTNDHSNNDDLENTMTMFHVVFVMNPPIAEYNFRIDEMFHFVVSRLSLILRYEQSKSNYVWNESKKIIKIKETNDDLSIDELYSKLIHESSLANALAQCFNCISKSTIANLEINDKLISLQIPLKNHFKSLPAKSTPVLPGSYLSSIMTNDDDDNELFQQPEYMGHMALLLLDEPNKIITDLKTEPGTPLALFITNIHPMLSLNKLAMLNQLDLFQLTVFAKHLIYWRRARAIIPLHVKSVFIVSPIAPLQNLQRDMKSFKLDFQSLPSLPSFLSLLSNSKPRQYATIIPSKDHRDIYLDALTRLIRYGYVTQLLTFVWLKIPNRIKIAVDEDLEKEGLTQRSDKKFKLTDISTDNTSKDHDGTKANDESNDNSSSNLKYFLNNREVEIEEEEEEDTILLDPERATAVERRWISKVIKGQPADIVATFYKAVKYFNGKTPLELILAKENISKQEAKRLLHGISECIISVKHW